MMEKPTTKTCAQCGANATLLCKGCSGIRPDTNEEVRIWYCGRKCQTAGWKEHKASCQEVQAVKLLHRACKLLQSIFYSTIREYTFGYSLEQVKKEDDKIHLYGGQMLHPYYFFKLPDLPILTSEDQKVVLSFLTCQQSVALVCKLYPRVLSGTSPLHSLIQCFMFHSQC